MLTRQTQRGHTERVGKEWSDVDSKPGTIGWKRSSGAEPRQRWQSLLLNVGDRLLILCVEYRYPELFLKKVARGVILRALGS